MTTVFKKGYTLQQLEILVRQPLFEIGLDYGHGTTHGVGSFLAVHEGIEPAHFLQYIILHISKIF